MDELTRTLWEYAKVCRLEGCYDLDMKREREENEAAAERNRETLAASAQPPILDRLENLCYCLDVIRSVDLEAAFTCGLRLGLSLR